MGDLSFNKKIPSFWSKFLNRESLVFLVLLGMSATCWMLIALDKTYEKESVMIPVRLIDVPDNIILLDEPMDTVVVSITASGNDFLYYTFNPIAPIKLKFATYNQDGKIVVTLSELNKLIKQNLSAKTKIVSIKSEGLSFRYNKGEHVRLPVRFKGKFSSKIVADMTLIPDSVDVYATPSMLSSLREIRTMEDSIDVKEEVTISFPLERISGVKCKPNTIKANIKPLIYVENAKEITVECINEPENVKLRLFPPKVSVIYMVDMKKLNIVKDDMFRVVADYNEIADRKKANCPIRLVESPSFVKNARLSADGAKYLIEER